MGSMNLKGALDVLLVQRAAAVGYPPTINQANLLAESGLRVGLVDCPREEPLEGDEALLSPGIQRWGVRSRRGTSLTRLTDGFAFKRRVVSAIRQTRPRVIVAYDCAGAFAVGRPDRCTARVIWHSHEYPEMLRGMGFIQRKAVEFVFRYARVTDGIIFPDANRAQCFQRETRLKNVPWVVMNCPRKLKSLPKGILRKKLVSSGVEVKGPIVLFQGSVGYNQCLERVIRSMRWWPHDAIFIMLGPLASDWGSHLMRIAKEDRVNHRVVFVNSVSYSNLFSHTVDADIGVGFYEPNRTNHVFMSGACNKRLEYMACGIPQVADQGPGMRELVEKNECGLSADPFDPKEIGQAINYLLTHTATAQRMGRNGRTAHLGSLNYETQFWAVRDKILSWCGDAG
jgi:glycosyltransferase involved in cell wall biosynthesis